MPFWLVLWSSVTTVVPLVEFAIVIVAEGVLWFVLRLRASLRQV